MSCRRTEQEIRIFGVVAKAVLSVAPVACFDLVSCDSILMGCVFTLSSTVLVEAPVARSIPSSNVAALV